MELHCWGDKQVGQSQASTPVPWTWNKPEQLLNIACGKQHTLFLTKKGNVFSHGNNSKGQLGREHIKDPKSPTRVAGLNDVVSVACGKNHCIALTSSGDVYAWGAGSDGQLGTGSSCPSKLYTPRPVPMMLETLVVQVSCGNSHTLALTIMGDVFSWGSNSHGQLGLGKDVSQQPSPAQVLSLSGTAVSQISAGGSHSLFLTLPGLVYCCGANKYGQLGLNRVDEKGRFNVCVVPALRALEVSFMSCGNNHSAILTKDRKVFTFGEGSQGQLGHNSTANELIPRQVQGIDGRPVQIKCGSEHTVVLVSSGQLWSFGNGDNGQLGNGSLKGSLTPNLVQLPWTTDKPAIKAKDMVLASGWSTNYICAAIEKDYIKALNSEVQKPLGRLDQLKFQKWVMAGKSCEEAIRYLTMMFYTSSCLVASFTKPSTGPPLAIDALTVDVDYANKCFDLMLRLPWLKEQIKFAHIMDLVIEAREVMKSPEIFMILLTCPILQEEQHVMNFVVPLAICIVGLNEKTLETLRGWWASLEPSNLKRVILVFKKALAFMLKTGLLHTNNLGIKYLLKVLKLVYKANKGEKYPKVPLSTFYVEEVAGNVDPFVDAFAWRQCASWKDELTPAIFCRYPFLLNPGCKIAVFNIDTRRSMVYKRVHRLVDKWSSLWPAGASPDIPDATPAPDLQLKPRRRHLLEDTFRLLGAADPTAYRGELMVQFEEDSNLTEVNRRDFFFHVFDELMAPEAQMFMYNETKTLAWFPIKMKVELKSYYLFGVLVGMAMFNNILSHLPFPLVLFKKLLYIKPSVDDMKEFEPAIAESLRCILEDYNDDVVDDMLMTFTVPWDGSNVELDPKLKGKPVTSSNKKEFVDAFVNYTFNTSVGRVFEEFKRGFYKVCDRDAVELFQPDELQAVMVGQETYDWNVLKKNTEYEGEYNAKHPNIITFWEVFEELTEDQKKGLLLFVTGCDRVPILGMDQIKMKIAVRPQSFELHFPESLTCESLLLLPIYQRYPVKRTLHNRLMVAINHRRGFWME